MPINLRRVGEVADGSVTTAKLADNAVTTQKLNDGAVIQRYPIQEQLIAIRRK